MGWSSKSPKGNWVEMKSPQKTVQRMGLFSPITVFSSGWQHHTRMSLVSNKKTQIPSEIVGRKGILGDLYVPWSYFKLIFFEGFCWCTVKVTSSLKINGWKMKTSAFWDGLLFSGAILVSRYCDLIVLPTNFLTRLLWTDWKVLPVLFGMWNSLNTEGQLTKSYQVWYSFRICQINR